MQNEITELRNQVRTLKRIVCLVCCLFVVFMFTGCSSRGANVNSGSTYTSNNTDESVLLLLDAIGAPLPELLSDQQIAAMSEAELRVAISDVAEALVFIHGYDHRARLTKEQQIAVMSEAELRVAISDVAEALDRIGNRNEEAKTRLRKEFHLLLDRLKDLQNARRKN